MCSQERVCLRACLFCPCGKQQAWGRRRRPAENYAACPAQMSGRCVAEAAGGWSAGDVCQHVCMHCAEVSKRCEASRYLACQSTRCCRALGPCWQHSHAGGPTPMRAQELSEFVAASWAELRDDDSGTTYYYNQVPRQAPAAGWLSSVGARATRACLAVSPCCLVSATASVLHPTDVAQIASSARHRCSVSYFDIEATSSGWWSRTSATTAGCC